MLLKDYKTAALFDELVDEHGQVRPYYRGVTERLSGLNPEELTQKIRSLELLFLIQLSGETIGTRYPFGGVTGARPIGRCGCT